MLRRVSHVGIVACFMAFVMFVVGCSMTVSQRKDSAYKTMAVLGNSYDTAMKSISQLSKDGLLTDDEKKAALQAAAVFWGAYQETLLAMEIWWAVEDATTEEKFSTALAGLMSKYKEMMAILEPLLKRARV
jgi:hypothetical protein